MSSATGPRVDVIVPVHNGERHLDEFLTHLLAEVPAGSILVVDDASTDRTAQIAEGHGVRLLRQAVAAGPYAARNAGWQSSSAELIVFTDVRCRPRPGWLASLLTAVSAPGVAIAGCDVEMTATDPTVAERWAIRRQPLRIDGYLTHAFLPYVATACLAITRADLVLLDGFLPLRSGSDADFCWRAQQAGLGTVVAADIGMWGRPRTTDAEVIEQFRRYGVSAWQLQATYGYRGTPPKPPSRRGTAARAVQAGWELRRDPALARLDIRRLVAFENQFRTEAGNHAEGAPA